MTIFLVLGAFISCGLFIYLFVALLSPETFQ